MPNSNVGASEDRTKMKHSALDKFLGANVGAASVMHRDVVLIDLTAGDGQPSQFSDTSSPEIFAKHLHFPNKNGRHLYLVESSRTTFRQLQDSIPWISLRIKWPELADYLTVICGDHRNNEVADQLTRITPQSVVFLFLDPNTAAQVELSPTLLSRLPEYTTWMVSLGVNAHGTKRASFSTRSKWLKEIFNLLRTVDRTHQDAVLIVLKGDSDQWAYLVNTPSVWRNKTETLIRSLRKNWPKGITHYWLSDGTLIPALRELFLTNDELKKYRQPELF
jgi:hypothetical protein